MCYQEVNESGETKRNAGFLLSAPHSARPRHVRSHTHKTAAAVGALAAVAALTVAAPPAAAAGRDVTADVLADRDVTLSGDTVVTVPPGTTTYDGVLRGQGTPPCAAPARWSSPGTATSPCRSPGSGSRWASSAANHPYVTTGRPLQGRQQRLAGAEQHEQSPVPVPIGGSGSLTQSGAATTSLTGSAVTYTGTTTLEKGTLALRGGATLAPSRAIRLTSPKSLLDAGTSGLRVGAGRTLTGKGTVTGAVTSDGVVAGGLTVSGDYTQSGVGELVLRDGPLKVTGAVRLAGDLDLAAVAATAGADRARSITVPDHRGRSMTTGSFTGLKEGAKLQLDDTTYRIGYRGGDGNDVVLTAVSASPSPSSSATDAARTAAGPPASPGTRTANAAVGGIGWWPYVLAAGLLVGLAVPATRFGRGRGQRPGGRHAAQGR
ncbi:hypothetical protein AB0C70_41765 [Streptomyces sp. NPDC048564]|uniref:hypothetical protein n=1 Tax=Streptomyces sp. NPDC048564 TaxID=3155760 RepID=UPI003427C874